MKAFKIALLLAAVLVGAAASAAALAHGRHHHHPRARVGVFIGVPVVVSPFYRPYYYAPYYYPPVYYAPAVVVPSPPPAYIEQPQAAPQRADPYWYYCPEARAYYPYVQQCAGGWQRVVPQPPPPS